MTAGCADHRLALGAYVLGSLDPTERAAVEDHLEGCPACRDELADLAGLPGLLGRVDLADALTLGDPLPPPPPELFDRLLAAAARQRRTSRRWKIVASAAAAVVVLAGAAAVTTEAVGSGHHTATTGTTFSATDPTSHVTARVIARPRTWGTAVRASVTGVAEGETCSLVVVSRSGVRDVAASWRIGYSGGVDVTGASAVAMSDIARFEVVTTDGQRLVSVRA